MNKINLIYKRLFSNKNNNWWIKRQSSDPFVKLAKEKGYRSRGSIKLEEILNV